MLYNQNPSQMNAPGGDFHALVDAICSYLVDGEMWHRRAANECRKLGVRGWGRWHEAEAEGDSHLLTCLCKLLVDNCNYIPKLDMTGANKSAAYSMSNLGDFKNSHEEWIQRETMLIDILNNAIHESRSANMEVYYKLCGVQEEVQNEAMRVEWIARRLGLSNWNGSDLGLISMKIHKYFECEYKGGKIDFNVG